MSLINKAGALALAALLAFGAGMSAPTTEAQARAYTKSQAKSHAKHKKHARNHDGRRTHRSTKRRRVARGSASTSRHAHRSPRRKTARTASYRHHRMGLGASVTTHTRRAVAPSRVSGNVSWSASQGCLNSTLRSVVHQVAARYGSLRVNSTCRSRARNRRVGGARHSHHLGGNAVDFRVFGNVRAVASFLRSHSSVGGYKHYGGGLFHIDTGPRRSW